HLMSVETLQLLMVMMTTVRAGIGAMDGRTAGIYSSAVGCAAVIVTAAWNHVHHVMGPAAVMGAVAVVMDVALKSVIAILVLLHVLVNYHHLSIICIGHNVY